MNDLVSMKNRMLEAFSKFYEIKGLDDLELWLMQGQGMSANTYATYREAVKQFFDFYDNLHPCQWTPGHIEKFYDDCRSRTGISTAYNRMAGLKFICKSIKQELPLYENPFDIMSEETTRKINTTEQGKKKKALFIKELQAVLDYLREDVSLKGIQNFAIVLTLVTTGLRAQELCNLHYGSIEHDPDLDRWYLNGIGKGDKPYRVELYPAALDAIRLQFKARMHREMRFGDYLFYSLENYRGKGPAQMQKGTMWVRLRDIGQALKNRGLIRQEIEFSAHLFRRTFLTLLSKAGMSVAALQEHSRHANIETLINHYVDDTESTRPYLDKILGVA